MAISPDEKQQVVELMLAGHDWEEATRQAGVNVSVSTAYRWVREWRAKGKAGLSDGRHGHPYKITLEIRAWLKEFCGRAPHTPNSKVREMLKAKFEVEVSRGHLNLVRAELGVSRPKKSRGAINAAGRPRKTSFGTFCCP